MQRMKVSAVFSVVLVLSSLVGTAAAEELTLVYSFERPEISKVTIAGTWYDRVAMPGVANGGTAGQPALPADGAYILLPFATKVSKIEVVVNERVSLGRDYLIEPVSRPVPLSAGPGAAQPPSPAPAIYDSDRAFPENRFTRIGTQGFRGYQILILKLHPVEYVPSCGEVFYYPRLTVVVDTVGVHKPLSCFRGLAEDKAQVLGKVDNPGVAETYPAAGVRGDKSYDLLIVTTPALSAAFEPLKTHHDANGVLTEIHTTTDIGSSNPDDIRDYIRDRHDNDGIEYVLIGGDDDVIAAKDLYVQTDDGPWPYIEENMPADIFFGCLDGTYNYDGDSYWGEPGDGEGGGDVDLVAEVYVGRASVGNTTEATRFVDKTIWYVTGQHAHPEKALLVGEYLGFGGVSEYAGDTLDELIDGASTHGYTTVGIPSDEYVIDTLYERDWPGHNWAQSELITRINNGVHFLNHLGHGSPDYAMKLYNSDVLSSLTNTDLCFVYSQTCLAGHFDGTDCWAETMNIKTDYGAFAVVMNAREGFGDYDTTDGPSQRFNRELWDAVFNQAEAKPELGRANQDAKEDNLYRIDEDCMRWITYESNLFGDPTVALREVTGLKVTPDAELESEGPNGGPFTPDSIVYTLENMGPGAISYEVTKTVAWLTVTNGSGTLSNIGDTVEVVVSINANAESLDDGTYYDTVSFVNTTDHMGDTTRGVSLKVGIPVVVYEWPLNVNPGWTAGGEWEFGPATAGGSNNGDPGYAHTGTNIYGYNLGGDYPDYLPATYLTTEPIDCTGLSDVTLAFWRWLGVESNSHYDEATIEASNNGSDWTILWRATDTGDDIADNVWVLQEVNLSSVADDQLTVYIRWGMGPTDGGVTFPGWNIDDVQIMALGGEPPALFILLPDGVPAYFGPGVATTFAVQILDGGESYVPGSGTLHYRYDGGAFLTSPLAHVSGNLYEATLPTAGCTSTPEFYVSADGDGGATVSNPLSAPSTVFTADVGTFATIMEDDFETDQGWTAENLGATSGDWERGVPVDDPSWDYDPASDSDGSGQCYLTQNEMGNTDVDNGAVRLTSPTIDMSTGEITISYDYYLFLTNTDGGVDRLLVEIDGHDGAGPWTEVSRHDSSGGLNWRSHVIDQADLDAAGVTLTSTTRLRFTTNDADDQSINESGLDAFLVTAFECVSLEEPVITTQPASQTWCVDESATFTVEVTGMPPFSYQWKYNGDDIPDANGPSYTINSVSTGDTGAYRCEVTNDFGSALSNEATLTVITVDDCDDGSVCTVDSCAEGACVNTDTTPEGQCCDPLTGDWTEMDDGNACTDDVCNPDGTVEHVDNFDPDTECCDPITGLTIPLDDGNACTDDTCNADGTVNHVDNFDPGVECCSPSSGETIPIDDGSDCTIDECDPATGIVDHTVLAPGAVGEGARSLGVTLPTCSDELALFVTSPTYPCLGKYVNADGVLVDSPVRQTPGAWGAVHVHGEDIVPSAMYLVHAEHVDAGASERVTATTWAFGDVDDDGNDLVGVTEILLVIAAYQSNFTNVTLEAADLDPCVPDGIVGLGDILCVIAAYQGKTYADTGCPIPCQ